MKKLLLTLSLLVLIGSATASTQSDVSQVGSATASAKLNVSEIQRNLDNQLLKKPVVEFDLLLNSTVPQACTISGNCVTCFGRTFCVEK